MSVHRNPEQIAKIHAVFLEQKFSCVFPIKSILNSEVVRATLKCSYHSGKLVKTDLFPHLKVESAYSGILPTFFGCHILKKFGLYYNITIPFCLL